MFLQTVLLTLAVFMSQDTLNLCDKLTNKLFFTVYLNMPLIVAFFVRRNLSLQTPYGHLFITDSSLRPEDATIRTIPTTVDSWVCLFGIHIKEVQLLLFY